MCTENKELNILKADHEQDIMEAVTIIKEFGPDIKMINSMLMDHSRRIDEEVQERKSESREMRNNYIDRFSDIKTDIKDVRKDIRNSFIGIAIFFFTTISGFILAKIGGLL